MRVVKVTVSLDAQRFGIGPDAYGLTGVRINPDGSYSILGGSFVNGRFEFITDRLSFYALLRGVSFDSLALTVGNPTFTVNGARRSLDVAPLIIDDRTMVPICAVAEGLGASVDWDEAANYVSIVLTYHKISTLPLNAVLV